MYNLDSFVGDLHLIRDSISDMEFNDSVIRYNHDHSNLELLVGGVKLVNLSLISAFMDLERSYETRLLFKEDLAKILNKIDQFIIDYELHREYNISLLPYGFKIYKYGYIADMRYPVEVLRIEFFSKLSWLESLIFYFKKKKFNYVKSK